MIDLYGIDLFGQCSAPKPSGPVAERFLFSPFTVLDAKSGEWQERKRAWLSLGIVSELGRGEALAFAESEGDFLGREMGARGGGTSVFDPVLCELACRWFSPESGQVVDPFAGGSVRGIVASKLGRKYWGGGLRQEQVAANRAQADQICDQNKPVWVVGDSMETLLDAPDADFIFSCPPYGDLEVYSDDPADLSNMEWHTFSAAYRRIIQRAVSRLMPNRFACFVVGDFRDGKGFYRDFVSQTIRAFEDADARLYNEAILTTPVGTACMRVTKQFEATRKLAKTHQNILVFCKGDPRAATKACKGAST